MKNRTLHYIIRFLVGDDVPSELVETIGYTADPNKFDRYTSLSFHPASLMDKHTGLPLPYRNSPCKRFKVSPCYSARRKRNG